MSATKCRRHGKPYPCGKCRIESKSKPPQTPPIPTHQLLPTAGQEAATKQNLHIATVWHIRRGKKPVPHVVSSEWAAAKGNKLSMREHSGLSRRDVGQLLLNSDIAKSIAPHEVTQYKRLAAGNISEEDLAREIGLRDTAGLGAYLDNLEKQILRRALYLGIRFEGQTATHSEDFDRQADFDDESENASIVKTGGASIGGRIISRGPKMTEGRTFTDEGLDSFERGGRLRTTGNAGKDRSAAEDRGGPDFDDFSEDSDAE
jgi:hypothetical protein